MTVSLAHLKQVKNTVIGNPSAKLQLAQDDHFIQSLVQCLNHPPTESPDEVRLEAAHIITSISYGSEDALAGLLTADVLRAFLYALSVFSAVDPPTLKAAFARGLRATATAIADTVGPSQWGLRAAVSAIRTEARLALDTLFQIDSLDIFLPLLVDTSTQTGTSIALLLASTVRTPDHRKAVTDWLPPSERLKEIKSKRGWEKTSTASVPSRQGGWVVRHLLGLLQSRDVKLQEAALSGLASLAKENPLIANVLLRPATSTERNLSTILNFSRSRSADVQLAACLCATHIIRASSSSHSVPIEDSSAARTVMNVVNRMIAGPSESPQIQTKACFILYDTILSHIAYDRGSLEKLATLVQSITPTEGEVDSEEDEPESTSSLREACLTAIAAIALFDNDIRRAITDDLRLLPTIHASLSHQHIGVRYAACQCIRALSRAVAVLRTNIVDSGLGLAVFEIFKKEDEDRRVLLAALTAVCNIVNEFSPLKMVYLEHGLMPRIVQLVGLGDSTLRMNALWAVKNLLRKCPLEIKIDVMNQLGWDNLVLYLSDSGDGIPEQALNIIRNIVEDEGGIDLVFQELGASVLLDHLTASLASPNDQIVLQAAYVLANLVNGQISQQNSIVSHPQVLMSIRTCLAESKAEIRRPAVACLLRLVKSNPGTRRKILDAGIGSTLRHISEWGGGLAMSPGGTRMHATHSVLVEDDKYIVNEARQVLDFLEHDDVYS